MYKKFVKLIKKNGIIGTINLCYAWLSENPHLTYFSVNDIIHRRRIQNSEKLWRKLKGIVKYGPLKGFIIDNGYFWSRADLGNMLLGLYEKEVMDELLAASPSRDTLIDLGAADGYFAVGCLVNRIFKKTYCFEQSFKSRNEIAHNAEINKVSGDIKIFGYASRKFNLELIKFGVDLSRSVILCDIEGGEFDLFNKTVLKELKNSLIIIEIHDWHKNGKQKFKKLKKNASSYFKVSEIRTGTRDLSIYPEIRDLRDNDRWLLCSEGRNYLQTWLKLTPR